MNQSFSATQFQLHGTNQYGTQHYLLLKPTYIQTAVLDSCSLPYARGWHGRYLLSHFRLHRCRLCLLFGRFVRIEHAHQAAFRRDLACKLDELRPRTRMGRLSLHVQIMRKYAVHAQVGNFYQVSYLPDGATITDSSE